MKRYRQISLLLGAAAMIAAALLAGVWLISPTILASHFAARLVVVVFCTAILCGAGCAAWLHINGERKTIQQHLEHLCRNDQYAYHRENSSSPLQASRLINSSWRQVCRNVQECISEYSRRNEELELVRAGGEVRSRRLNSEHKQMSEIIAGLPYPILVIDHFDELIMANSTAEKIFDIDIHECENRSLGTVVKSKQLVKLLTDTRRRESTAPRSEEIDLPLGDGQTQAFRVLCRCISTSDESTGQSKTPQFGAMAVLRDIDGIKELRKRNAEFISSVSHEMKTPLTSIKAYVELLVDGDAEDETTREEFLEVINGQASRLQRLIDNLLDIARIEAGVVNVSKTPLSLNEVLEEAFHVVQPSAEQKQINFSLDLSTMYLGVLADRDMLLQSAINLLSNAVKYTPNEGKVRLHSRMADSEVVFEVEDSGVGLSSEDCEKVFSKFYRVQKDKQMASGTGLGLPLAKHIVEDVHNGSLDVSSTPGKGSTFRITLPKERELAGVKS